jgi:hypothetical protein
MVALPEEVLNALNSPTAAKTLATPRPDGNIHVIQLGSMMAPDPNTIVFGAILMNEAGKNLEHAKSKNKMVSILVTSEMKSYQVRAKVKDFVTSGPLYDKMNEHLARIKMKARGVWVVEPAEVWNQSPSMEAGKRMV